MNSGALQGILYFMLYADNYWLVVIYNFNSHATFVFRSELFEVRAALTYDWFRNHIDQLHKLKYNIKNNDMALRTLSLQFALKFPIICVIL